MVKRIFAVLFAVLPMLYGCTGEQRPLSEDSGTEYMCFAVSSNVDDEEGKSSYKVGDPSVIWHNEDSLSVFDGVSNCAFYCADTGSEVSFYGKAVKADNYYAVYPYCAASSMSAPGKITAVLPSEQIAVPDSFSDRANLSVAKSSGSTFQMKNVGGYIRLTLAEGNDNINSITVKANGGEILSGSISIIYNGSSFSTSSAEGKSCVTLLPENGKNIAPGTYFIVANAVTMASGFSVLFSNLEGKVAVKSTSRPNTIVRNRNLDLGTLDPSKLEWTADSRIRTYSMSAFSTNLKYAGTDKSFVLPTSKSNARAGVTDRYRYTPYGDDMVFDISVPAGIQSGSTGNYFVAARLSFYKGGTYVEIPGIPGYDLVKVHAVFYYSSGTKTMSVRYADKSSLAVGGDAQTHGVGTKNLSPADWYVRKSYILADGQSYYLLLSSNTTFVDSLTYTYRKCTTD